jgi:transcriptional regulator with XRE-family HTH domain
MNKPEWTPKLGLLLESLRIQAGMDLATMARRNMLSTLQVKQLEKGGSSGFYNEDIKFSTGQKLLKFFGHELKLETETAVPETVSAVPAAELSPTPAPALAIEPVSLPPPKVAAKPSKVATESIKPMPIELIEPSDEQPEASTSNAKPYWLGLAFIVIAMLVFGFFQTYGPANPSLNTAPSLESKLKPPESEKMSPQQVDAASAPSTSTQAAPEKSNMSAVAASEKIETPQLLNMTCKWTDQETELQASAPRKRGEYVHVVALENATVCIKDGDQRVASLSLASGQARSIYGPPPFRVYSPNLSLVKLYFQGEYIKLPSEDIRQIKLSPSSLQ